MSLTLTPLVRGLAVATSLGLSVLPVDAGPMASQAFRRAEAPVSGSYTIKTSDGQKMLVLSGDFRTNEQAPDLKVILGRSATPLAMSAPPKYELKEGSYTILAPLKSSAGAQSYAIPASVDLAKHGSVMIWCQKFNATMAWAPLRP